MILYGAYDRGTTGATDFAITDKRIKELLQNTKSSNNIWGLVELTIRKGNISDVKLKACDGLTFRNDISANST